MSIPPDRHPAVFTGISGALLAVALGAPLVGWSHLPDQVAVHWGWSGDPDGSAPRAVALVVVGVLVGAGAFLLGLSRLSTRRPVATGTGPGVPWLAAGFLAAELSAALSLAIVAANWEVGTWMAARSLSPVGVIMTLVATAFASAGAVRWADPNAAAPPTDPAQRATVGLRAGERAMWIGHARSPWGWPVAAAGAAIVLGSAVVGPPVAGIAGVLLAAGGITFTSARVLVGGNGITVRFGPLAWPAVRIPLDQIAVGEAATIVPTASGGWGYRGSLRLFGHAAVVLRSGPGLKVTRRDGAVLLVSVDDPAEGAGALNDLVGGTPRRQAPRKSS